MTMELVNREEVRIDEVGVKKLYIVNNGAENVDMMLVPLMLPPYYRVVRVNDEIGRASCRERV